MAVYGRLAMGCASLLRSSAIGLIVLSLFGASPASAAQAELSETEMAALEAGRPVVREETVERAGHRYIGGVSYIVINAPAAQVTATLGDVRTYRQILPSTRSVRWIALSRTGDALIELEQGNAIAHGKYTVRIRHDAPAVDNAAAIFRFWLDPRYSHDFPDANGFFRVEPRGDRTLLTCLVRVDLGPGLFQRLFESRVRKTALSTPMLVKSYVESRGPV
jgi:hypothetical protein